MARAVSDKFICVYVWFFWVLFFVFFVFFDFLLFWVLVFRGSFCLVSQKGF